MGEAKRRRELGHTRRQNTYIFVVSEGPTIEYQGALPVDEDDEEGVRDVVEQFFGRQPWAQEMAELLRDYGVADVPSTPTHVRCEMTVDRTRHGSHVFYDSPVLDERAYSLDGGQTWHALPEEPLDPEDLRLARPSSSSPLG